MLFVLDVDLNSQLTCPSHVTSTHLNARSDRGQMSGRCQCYPPRSQFTHGAQVCPAPNTTWGFGGGSCRHFSCGVQARVFRTDHTCPPDHRVAAQTSSDHPIVRAARHARLASRYRAAKPLWQSCMCPPLEGGGTPACATETDRVLVVRGVFFA